MINQTVKIPLKGHINTNVQGHKILLRFYYACKEYNNCKIEIDLVDLKWFDANLCGLLLAITEDLRETNQLDFDIPKEYWLVSYPNNFDVLHRNKFISMLLEKSIRVTEIIDNQMSTIELQKFYLTEIDEFCTYIENIFLKHRGCTIGDDAKEELSTAYTELFANYQNHSQTEKPIYVCGQYFPKKNKLCFSITDVGIGFFVPIQQYTKTTGNPINDTQTAIKWALEYSNTTSINKTGGQGLHNIEKFCRTNNGDFHIISDNIYTHHNFKKNKRDFETLNTTFKGVTIHLFF